MKPGKLDLPTVWRGRTYPQIILTWLDQDGNPIDLTGWTPHATSKQINFHPDVTDPLNGVTSISLTKTETAGLKLGVENWDWIWDNNGDGTPPLLAGSVQIKEPVTSGSGNVGPPSGLQPPTLIPPSFHGARFPIPVVISVTDPNQAAISIYTTDGTNPTWTNGTHDTRRAVLAITMTTTVKAITAVDANNVSSIVSGFYTDQP